MCLPVFVGSACMQTWHVSALVMALVSMSTWQPAPGCWHFSPGDCSCNRMRNQKPCALALGRLWDWLWAGAEAGVPKIAGNNRQAKWQLEWRALGLREMILGGGLRVVKIPGSRADRRHLIMSSPKSATDTNWANWGTLRVGGGQLHVAISASCHLAEHTWPSHLKCLSGPSSSAVCLVFRPMAKLSNYSLTPTPAPI